MDHLDRFLESVRKYLPWQGQDDIIAELRANLESQREDKEAELGRPLSAEETEAWLKQIGSPMQMAAHYQPQRYLIGPAFFPIYWFVLRLAMMWAAAVYTIVSVVQIAVGPSNWPAFLDAMLRLPGVLITTAGWVTVIFAGIEFATVRYPSLCRPITGPSGDWAAKTLPDFEKAMTPKKKRRTFAHAIAEVVFGTLFLAWWLLVPQHPYLLWGPGAAFLKSSPFQLTPVWTDFYWCVVVLNVVQLAWRIVDLVRRTWQGERRAEQFAVKIFGLIPLILLLSSNVWITLKDPAASQAQYGPTVQAINQITRMSLVIVSAIITLQLLWEIGQLSLAYYRKRAAAKS